MRTIIAGSRSILRMSIVEFAVIASEIIPTVVLSGTAGGVDKLGESWAHRLNIPVERYPADWNTFGKRAGFVRNEIMADNADALIAIHDGYSKGTRHMIDIARKKNLRVFVYLIDMLE
jgi:hypothetical protein